MALAPDVAASSRGAELLPILKDACRYLWAAYQDDPNGPYLVFPRYRRSAGQEFGAPLVRVSEQEARQALVS